MRLRYLEAVAAAALGAAAVCYLYLAWKLPVPRYAVASTPGFLPLVLGTLMLGLCAALLGKALLARDPQADTAVEFSAIGVARIAGVLVALLGYVLLLEPLGIPAELVPVPRRGDTAVRSRAVVDVARSARRRGGRGPHRLRRDPAPAASLRPAAPVMEILQSLAYGFSVALTPHNLFYCFLGTVLGTAVGVLPGLGTITGVAILIPATLGMNPTSALIMLAGIYYGAQYGGSTTAILMNLPGESTAVMTCLDGHQLARQGRAGQALGMAAIASFIAGTVSVVGLMLIAPTLAKVALTFGPPEYAALMILSLSTIGGLLGESVIKGMMTAVLGLMIGTVGIDTQSGVSRFTFGMPELLGGIGFLPVIIGLFGVAEVLENIEQGLRREALAGRFIACCRAPPNGSRAACRSCAAR